MRHLVVTAAMILGLCAPAMALAGTTTGTLLVKVSLVRNSPGICISQTLSEQTNALVQVTCETGQFVSITPLPGKPFLGTHGGAFRYGVNNNNVSGGGLNADAHYTGAGTVTALRIYNADGTDGPLEMLVSF